MNSIVLMGRATSAIELKFTQSGKSVANCSLAVKRPFTKDTVDFINIVAWDKQAEVLSKYVAKGDMVCVRGSLQTRNWTDDNGNKRHATEVMVSEVSFAQTKRNSENTSITAEEAAAQGNLAPYTIEDFEVVKDEDLPF